MWPLSAEGEAASPWPRKLRHAADSTWSCWRKSCGLICKALLNPGEHHGRAIAIRASLGATGMAFLALSDALCHSAVNSWPGTRGIEPGISFDRWRAGWLTPGRD